MTYLVYSFANNFLKGLVSMKVELSGSELIELNQKIYGKQ